MNVYVGNLSYGTSSDDLRELFEPYGEVTSANVISDRDSGRSKGFGFVEMADDAQAREAIEKVNGTEIGGRTITVNEARPREDRGGGGGSRGGSRGGGGGGGGYGGGRGRSRY